MLTERKVRGREQKNAPAFRSGLGIVTNPYPISLFFGFYYRSSVSGQFSPYFSFYFIGQFRVIVQQIFYRIPALTQFVGVVAEPATTFFTFLVCIIMVNTSLKK